MFLRYNIWAILWALAILYLSLSPNDNLPLISFKLSDKLMHAALYGIFQCLLLIGFYKQQRYGGLGKKHILYASAISISYGAVMEILQGVLPINRSCDLLDLVANITGIVLVTVVWRWGYVRRKGKNSN